MQNFFVPDIERVKAIKGGKGVDVLRRLLQIISARCELSPHNVSVSSNIEAPDGGIDGKVIADKEINSLYSKDLIFFGINVYQVKTGVFSASNEKNRRSLFFKKSNNPEFTPNGLHEGVRQCLDNNGTFIAFLFGDDNPDVKGADPLELIRLDLVKVNEKYKSANIKIWKANQIAHLLGFFPSISLPLKGVQAPVYPIDYIANQCGLDGADYLKTLKHDEVINQIKSAINAKNGLNHIRIVGEPGIGKTRMIYEAINATHFAAESIYCENADKLLLNHTIIDNILELVETSPITLIVDECNPNNRSDLHRKFRSVQRPMTLVTIHNEIDEQDYGNNEYLFVEPPCLSDEKISEILQSYGVPINDADHIAAHYCSGSPRVAHIVGTNLRDNPDLTSLTKLKGIDNIWDIYIADRKAPENVRRIRKLILSHVALFRKFGWANPVQHDAKLIWELIKKNVSHNISWDEFRQVIDDCKKRKILQGFATLYITPKLLHIKLWCDWWEIYSSQYDISNLLQALEGSPLYRWFADMVAYIDESSVAGNYLEKLLTIDGIFNTLPHFNDNGGGNLFLKLARVKPKAAVRAIIRALDKHTQNELMNFTNGRRSIIHALEIIALHGDCFIDAAKCLHKLAIAENEKWSNNATGIFVDLFTLGYGEIASTDLSPIERLPILVTYLKSDKKETRTLALKAFDNAFRISVSRTIIRERAGFSPDPKGWMPKTNSELHDVYKTYLVTFWELCNNYLNEDDTIIAIEILLHHARSFFSIKSEDFNKLFLEIFDALSNRDQNTKLKLIETIVTILRYDKTALSKEIADKLQTIHDGISENSFSSKLRRYIGLNLLEDRYSRDGKQIEVMSSKLNNLASSALQNMDSLKNDLPWLVSNEAKNGYDFGKNLGLLDIQGKLWPIIKEAWLSIGDKKSDLFIGGYLSGVFGNNKLAWEAYLEEIYKSSSAEQLPFLVLRSGMSPNIAELLYKAAKKNIFDSSLFGTFIYGGVVKDIPSNTMTQILELMLGKGNKDNICNALEIIGSLIYNNYMLEIVATNLCFNILSHPVFFTASKDRAIGSRSDYTWKEVALSLAKHDIEKAINLLSKCLEHLGEDGTIADNYKSDIWEFLDYTTQKCPEKTWPLIAKNIDPMRSNGFTIMQWLSQGITSKIEDRDYLTFHSLPRDTIFKWIDEKPQARAITMAHFSPFILSTYDEPSKSFIREMLERYGSANEVRHAISANYNTGSWCGEASIHLGEKLKLLEHYKATEKNKNVLCWLNEEIYNLNDAIKQAKISEERGD